jgi:hypothetical protein
MEIRERHWTYKLSAAFEMKLNNVQMFSGQQFIYPFFYSITATTATTAL